MSKPEYLGNIVGKSGNLLSFSLVDRERNQAIDLYFGTADDLDLANFLVKAWDVPADWKVLLLAKYLYLEGKKVGDGNFGIGEYMFRMPIFNYLVTGYLKDSSKSNIQVSVNSQMRLLEKDKAYLPYG